MTEFLAEYSDQIKEHAAREDRGPVLDCGVECDEIGFSRSHYFSPDFLLQLADLGIALEVTVYP